jgi:hypothetical protein
VRPRRAATVRSELANIGLAGRRLRSYPASKDCIATPRPPIVAGEDGIWKYRGVEYREATANDAEAIAELHADSWRRTTGARTWIRFLMVTSSLTE